MPWYDVMIVVCVYACVHAYMGVSRVTATIFWKLKITTLLSVLTLILYMYIVTFPWNSCTPDVTHTVKVPLHWSCNYCPPQASVFFNATPHMEQWQQCHYCFTLASPTLPLCSSDNTQHPQQTDIHAWGGIQTDNPSKWAAVDPHLKPCSYENRYSQCLLLITRKLRSYVNVYGTHTYKRPHNTCLVIFKYACH